MYSLSSVSLFLAVLLAGYLTEVCSTSPNPNPEASKAWKHDSIARFTTGRAMVERRLISLGGTLYHAALVLPVVDRDAICPHRANLDASLFTWSPYTAACLFAIICLGAPVRLAAYDGLGKHFTFRLAQPGQLITTGVYRYLQHPSYTGQALIAGANVLLFFRWDGAAGCLLPTGARAALDGWGAVGVVAVALVMVRQAVKRVRDEEAMLKETFGEDWVRWHSVTKRFIPGVF